VARVGIHPLFSAEFTDQVAHLKETRDVDRILGLFSSGSELIELLRRFPESGRELASEGPESLRAIRLRHAPFLVWYRYHADLDEVTLYRMFHVRQDRPPPRLSA
jgi:plasmid stabilization system protein ParE